MQRFAWNDHRNLLVAGLLAALQALRLAGCKTAYIDGSFTTSKDHPGDFDGCWEPAGVDFGKIDRVLLDFTNSRQAQKFKYHGELFVAGRAADLHGRTFLEFFQRDKQTGEPKGIVAIDLGTLP